MPRLFGRRYSRRQVQDLVGDMSQVAGVRRAELVEGNERGAGLVDSACSLKARVKQARNVPTVCQEPLSATSLLRLHFDACAPDSP